MRNTNICPKCGSKDIVAVPGKIGLFGIGYNIKVKRHGVYDRVRITRYVCCGCGFIEEWIDGVIEREWIKEKYANK